MIRNIGLTLCLLVAYGCTAAPEVKPLDTWANYEITSQPTTPGLAVPSQPQAGLFDVGGEELICYRPADAEQLSERLERLAANADAGEQYRLAYEAKAREAAALVDAGKLTEARANHLLETVANVERRSRNERITGMVESTILKILLVVLAL